MPKASLGFGHVDHGDRIVTIDPLTGRCWVGGRGRACWEPVGLAGWLAGLF